MADAQVTLRTRKFIRNPCSPVSRWSCESLRPQPLEHRRSRRRPPVYHAMETRKRRTITPARHSTLRRHVDVLHPNRPNVSKDELRQKLSELYKADKDQVSVFGFRTQYGGGKSTGFALIYDSNEAMKKFEPHYRLQRKNRMKTLTGTAKVKGAKTKKDK
ncbi:unnamed protein product [Aureobasidium pullulans]|nr:unnamed protein product [Aureobasidium pullulans]